MNNRPLVIIAGPTAIGKTSLSIELAKRINGQIISADSMQVYTGMDIGTAKIRKDEMQGIKHYLIDEYDPKDDFNITEFQRKAKDAINKIYEEGAIPIIVGGTGFYIQSVLYDIDFSKGDEDTSYRDYLYSLIKEHGEEYVYNMLRQVDAKSCEKIHMHDTKRVIRALEYYKQTGEKISDHNEESSKKTSNYNFAFFCIDDNRDEIYKRIDLRVDQMIEAGLIDEVKGLLDNGLNKNHVSMKGLGYKEIIDYLEGDISLEDAIYIIKRDTRHFAKRQITWFKRERDVIYLQKDSTEIMLNEALKIMKEKGII